jgi:hypothetical protein
MKAPSDAQAALLSLIEKVEADGEIVEWRTNVEEPHYKPSRARLVVEKVDREANTSHFPPPDEGRCDHRLATVEACLRHGWLGGLHARAIHFPEDSHRNRKAQVWELRQLDLTEDGIIALGLWRERKLKAPAKSLPTLSEREQEIVAMARRALELGYALAPREPARREVRRLRNDGWLTKRGCWVANSVSGLVPTDSAIVAVLPEYADEPIPLYPGQRVYPNRVSGLAEALS